MTSGTSWDRALVTGASSGIGEALARRLAAAGTSLVVVARNHQRLEALADELVGAHPGVAVEVLVADLSDADELARVEARVGDDERPVDLLVNNAGYGFNGAFGEIPIDDETAEIGVNIVALVRLCHVAAGVMTARGRGGILNVASVAGFQPGPFSANYSATKAYVLSFTQSIHEELQGHGVLATALCPGLTRTEFQQRGDYELEGLPGFFWQSADEVARAGLDAVTAGHAVVVPGLHNKALTTMARVAPMGIVRRVSGAVTSRVR